MSRKEMSYLKLSLTKFIVRRHPKASAKESTREASSAQKYVDVRSIILYQNQIKTQLWKQCLQIKKKKKSQYWTPQNSCKFVQLMAYQRSSLRFSVSIEVQYIHIYEI